MIDKTLKTLAQLKVYFLGAGPYIGLLNFIMLLSTFKQTFDVKISVFLIVPVGFLFTLLIGYLDYHLILKHQVEHSNRMNNRLNKIQDQLDKIEKLIGGIQ